MTRKGIVDQAPISRMPSRLIPTNTTQVMSIHDDRIQRSTRLGAPLIPDTALPPPVTRHQVMPDAYSSTVEAARHQNQEPTRR